MIQSKTWMGIPTSNSLKPSQTLVLNHGHLLCLWWNQTLPPALCWEISLLSQWNAILRVVLRWTYKLIPATHSQHVKSTNIPSMRCRRRAWKCIITRCWRKWTPTCVSQAWMIRMASRSSWPACQMIILPGSGNYTLSRIWHAMTFTNALSNTGVETSLKASDGLCGNQPTLSIPFSTLSVALTAICFRNNPILKCTWKSGVGRHRWGEIREDNNVPIED